MDELLNNKYYSFILFAAKSLGVSVVVMVFVFAMTKSAGMPFSSDELSKSFLDKEYDLEQLDLDEASQITNKNDNVFIDSVDDIDDAVKSVITKNDSFYHGTDDGSDLTNKSNTGESSKNPDFHGAANEIDATTISDIYKGGIDDISDTKLKTMLDTICTEYPKECKLLSLEGKFNNKDKYIYTLLSVYFMNKIDEGLQSKGRNLSDGFYKLILRANLSNDKSEGECYASRRGCADHNTLLINLQLIKSPEEYSNVLVHELSHIVDLGVVDGSSKKKDDIYTEFGDAEFAIDDPSILFYQISRTSETMRKKGSKKEDFVSMYGMTSPFEDMAEAGITYKNHNTYFKILALTNRSLYKKYQRWANLYNNKYINQDLKNALKAKNDNKTRVWDITKLK